MIDREHEFVCSGTELEPHATQSVVKMAKLGEAPPPPECPTCGRPMPKVFGSPTISFDRRWRISMGR